MAVSPARIRATLEHFDPLPPCTWSDKFQDSSLIYRRVCKKVNNKGGKLDRVLLPVRFYLLLCKLDGGVSRYLPYRQLQRVIVTRSRSGIFEVLFKVTPPEPDILLIMENHKNNDRPADEAEMRRMCDILARAKRACCQQDLEVEWRLEAPAQLKAMATLKKPAGYRTPTERVKASQHNTSPMAAAQQVASKEQEIQSLKNALAQKDAELASVRSAASPSPVASPAVQEKEDMYWGGVNIVAADSVEVRAEAARPRTLSAVSRSSPGKACHADEASYKQGQDASGVPVWSLEPRPADGGVRGGPVVEQTMKHPSFWQSSHFNPTALRASGPPTTATPVHTETSCDDLDYWIRFVQRWEAQGQLEVDGL